MAIIDATGDLRILQPFGQDFNNLPVVFPVDGTHGFLSAASADSETEPNQHGRNGILPRIFLGTIDLSGCQPPKPMPAQPQEELPSMSVPAMAGFIQDVKSSHDGGAYAVVVQGTARVFVDYPSGRVLPPFISPLAEGGSGAIHVSTNG